MSLRNIHFHKFEATGNDFLLFDNRDQRIDLTRCQVEQMCHRKHGAGADGIILLENDPTLDFRMRYFNADGQEASFCGNGGRSITALAQLLEINHDEYRFNAFDGIHTARVERRGARQWHVRLSMKDTSVDHPDLIDTGSPHHIIEVSELSKTDVEQEGRKWRHDPRFSPGGCNVNFVMWQGGQLHVRTYERGVEAETLSCGTGVTASAIRQHFNHPDGNYSVDILTPGGELRVQFLKRGSHFTSIFLEGAVHSPYSGVYYL